MKNFIINKRHFARSTTLTRGIQSSAIKIGFVGLGHMGSKMVVNLAGSGLCDNISIYDANPSAAANTIKLVESETPQKVTVVNATADLDTMSRQCSVIFSMLPNDLIVNDVSSQLLKSGFDNTNKFIHVSCSTISPTTSRSLESTHNSCGQDFITAPVFARPDGIARKQATWLVAGKSTPRSKAASLLSCGGNIVDMGDDVGAANIVKLCGNFLIATSIESISEAMVLAEKHGVDRHRVMEILSSSIFDCLIFKGYGQRVSHRDHQPGGFSLELGLKDVTLVSKAAREADVPMPFLSTLLDRYVSSKARGRAGLDWSAIGLGVAEDAGLDITADLDKNMKSLEKSE